VISPRYINKFSTTLSAVFNKSRKSTSNMKPKSCDVLHNAIKFPATLAGLKEIQSHALANV